MFTHAKRLKSIIPLSLVLLLGAAIAQAQTFRGGINGTVTDSTGAVAPGAKVVATDDETGIVHTTVSSSAGDFTFSDLPLGHYTIVVTAPGFATETVKAIPVSAGSIYTAPVRLSVAGSTAVVSVSASALALDTTTVTQTTVVESKSVEAMPLNGRDFTQLVALTPGYAGYSAGGDGSLNGTRFDQMNWQIDGIDNNDLWANIPAVNQGGVLGIAGIILPIDSVDQFSVQTQGAPEAGRNPGGVINLGLKSGTNKLHGSAYYFNRNEALAKATPFLSYGATKLVNRNYNLGFTFGGPVIHDKLFYFASFEKQVFKIGQSGLTTEPSAAYQAQAIALMQSHGVSVNPVMQNLLNTLWPAYSLTGPAQGENYASPDPETGHSYNGVFKADYAINSKNNLSFHGFRGEGNQIAPDGSELLYYYEVGPIHVHNYAIVLNSTITNSLSNQLLLGVNYFNQLFNDNKKDFDLASTGFISGSTYATVAPHFRISGFDSVGSVAPSGRNDIVGHITDTASLTKGKHDIRFGGEYRQGQIDAFNSGNSTGLFRFNGSVGPWASDNVSDNNVKSLADYLAGYIDSGATLATGDPTRQVFINTFDFFAQDAWRLSQRLTINYGVRYDYEGAPHDPFKNLSIFLPNQGFVFQGNQIGSLYSANKTAFSPRLGFSYQPSGKADMVVRGGFGLYYDQPITAAFLNNHTSNSSPIGIQANPAGSNPFFTLTKATPVTVVAGQPIFNSASPTCTPDAPCGAFTIAQNFSTPYVMSYNLNVQKSFGPRVVAQLGYVGNESRKLLATRDINQAAFNTNGGADQTSRPFYSAYPTLGNINQLGTFATGNYNSLQSTLRMSDYHGITTQVSYTWGHAFDEVSVSRSALPQDSNNFKGDYGQTDLDTRNTLTAYVSYNLPSTQKGPKLLTNGWQFNGLVNLHSGQPFSVYNGEDTTGTDENAQRLNLVTPNTNPFAGVSHTFIKANATNGGATEQWFNPAAFVEPPAGTVGTTARNQFGGPGYSDVDFSVFKTTAITERVHFQLRIEMFNVFNRYNLAPPANTLGGGFGTLYDTVGDYFGAPGLGPGEPFNMQLGGKIIF
jgi:hypothetical protein